MLILPQAYAKHTFKILNYIIEKFLHMLAAVFYCLQLINVFIPNFLYCMFFILCFFYCLCKNHCLFIFVHFLYDGIIKH